MRLFDTRTKSLLEFEPRETGKIGLFVCGPTVYDFSHLGHAKTYVQFDFVAKFFRAAGFEVKYLQNITDIDDKIIVRAAQKGVQTKDLAAEFEKYYCEDMAALGVDSVDAYIRATDHIPEIISQVERLMSKGAAYQVQDGIYFDLKAFARYGALSGRLDLKEGDAVSRIDENPEKRNSGDFCLWKFFKPDEPVWEAPFGAGRPGWHIEDTAITEKYLGEQYDIHGGAIDLIFPHHEAEIAQMEMISGKQPLVKYWMHTGFLTTSKRKMSKSENNFWTIRDALKRYDAKELRFLFVGHHYRDALELSEDNFSTAANTLQRIHNFARQIDPALDDAHAEAPCEACRKEVIDALSDDFDSPKAVTAVFELIRNINKDGLPGRRVKALFDFLDSFFGCLVPSDTAVPQEVMDLVGQRRTMRMARDFKGSDDLRGRIRGMGFEILDGKEADQVVPIKR
jgi:cysteinyl-tRNA synthetase